MTDKLGGSRERLGIETLVARSIGRGEMTTATLPVVTRGRKHYAFEYEKRPVVVLCPGSVSRGDGDFGEFFITGGCPQWLIHLDREQAVAVFHDGSRIGHLDVDRMMWLFKYGR